MDMVYELSVPNVQIEQGYVEIIQAEKGEPFYISYDKSYENCVKVENNKHFHKITCSLPKIHYKIYIPPQITEGACKLTLNAGLLEIQTSCAESEFLVKSGTISIENYKLDNTKELKAFVKSGLIEWNHKSYSGIEKALDLKGRGNNKVNLTVHSGIITVKDDLGDEK